MEPDTGTATGDPSLAELVAQFSGLYCEQLNITFDDSLLFVGRVLGGFSGARAARATRVDVAGIELVVDGADGEHVWFAEFEEPLTDLGDLNRAGIALVLRAREVSGEEGTTTAERQHEEMLRTRTFVTSVRAVEEVHPHLRRITFAGGDLDRFTPLGPDTFLYVLLPPPGRTELGIDSSFTWEGAQELAEEDRPVGAYYTLREWRADTHELDMLFVLHGDTGPASAWATRAQPGDAVALWGPREGWDPPPGAEWYLLVADDTGLPAVACILETLPDGARVQVIAEVDDETEHQELPVRPGVDVRWCHRYGAEPGTTTLLLDAVRALTFPPGTGYVWGGAESRAMTQVRKLARQERGLPRASVLLVGYWRHVAHGDDIDTDD